MSFFESNEIDNAVKEFIELIQKDEDSAIKYLDNINKKLLVRLLAHKVHATYIPSDNMLLYAIKQGKEKLVSKIVETNIIDPKYLNYKGQNALFFAVYNREYKIAINLLNTGLYNPQEMDKNKHIIFEYIEYQYEKYVKEHKENDIDLLINFFIKLLDYYIKNNITITSNEIFQDMIDFICSDQELQQKIKIKLSMITKMKKNNPMKIDVKKFKEIINLDNINFCDQPILAETTNPDNDLEIVIEPESNKSKAKSKAKKSRSHVIATLITTEQPVIALPDTEDNIDLNYHRNDVRFLLPKGYSPRDYRGGKITQKNSKKSKRRSKSGKSTHKYRDRCKHT
jgi:hypothetical protein